MIKNLKPQLFISLLLILSPFFVLADNSCQNDCSFWGQYQCQGVSGKNCGNYDNNSCLTWSPWQKCDSRCYFCGDKTCDSQCGEDYSNCSKDCKYPNPLPVVEAGINIEVWEGASVTL